MPPLVASKAGYVYLVTCPNRMYAKFGRWSNSLRSLKARYNTYYGKPEVVALWVDDAKEMEARVRERVAAERLQLFADKRVELVQCTPRMQELFAQTVGLSN